MMKNICLTLDFDGTAFAGWQRQPGERTVQGTIEAALADLCREPVGITGCSRTDAGVHGKNYVANFYSEATVPEDRWLFPLNDRLPEDVRVTASRLVADDFHAQRDAIKKTYLYRFHNRSADLALGRQYVHQEKGRLDEAAMVACARLFLGHQDFAAFRSTGSSAKTTDRHVYESELTKDGDIYTYRVTGNGFLYNMVRILVGSILYVGHGTRSLDDIRKALDTGDRLLAGKVAPARGLMLDQVVYRD